MLIGGLSKGKPIVSDGGHRVLAAIKRGETEIDAFSELQAIVADATVLSTDEIDTFAELQTIVTDATILDTDAIDTFAELQIIVTDTTYSKIKYRRKVYFYS